MPSDPSQKAGNKHEIPFHIGELDNFTLASSDLALEYLECNVIKLPYNGHKVLTRSHDLIACAGLKMRSLQSLEREIFITAHSVFQCHDYG
jgi:hypothetical protein